MAIYGFTLQRNDKQASTSKLPDKVIMSNMQEVYHKIIKQWYWQLECLTTITIKGSSPRGLYNI